MCFPCLQCPDISLYLLMVEIFFSFLSGMSGMADDLTKRAVGLSSGGDALVWLQVVSLEK